MLKMIDPDRAQSLVLAAVAGAARIERVAIDEAIGRVLAETVVADRDYPPFDRAMMDGYAVRVADAGSEVAVVGEVRAGQAPSVTVQAGRAVAVMTGASCPPGTEAVVVNEAIEHRDEGRVALPDSGAVTAGQHVAPRGCEKAAGQVVLERGARLSPAGIGALAAVGQDEVAVWGLPRMAVIATGDELVDASTEAPPPEKIRDSNGPMLAALARWVGVPQPVMLRAADTLEGLQRALQRAEGFEFVVLSGGVSAGRYDLVPAALVEVGAEVVFHKVTQKPGKPLLLATRGEQVLFGLPGNPVSSHLCFHRYVAPALRRWSGMQPLPPIAGGRLAEQLSVKSQRTLFVQARAETRSDGTWLTPLIGHGSADLYAGVRGNAYLRFEPGSHELAAATEVGFEWMMGIAEAT